MGKNLLDYRLMMLHITSLEIIRSPTMTPLPLKSLPELDLLMSAVDSLAKPPEMAN